MENTEWPDAEKLKDLRASGVFPYSLLTISCITTAALLSVTYLQLGFFTEAFVLMKKMLEEPVSNFAAVQAHSGQLIPILSRIFFVYGATFVFTFLLIVFLQSKFYFSLVNLSFDLSQIIRIKNISFKFFLATISRGVFGLALGFAIGSALFYWVSRQFLGIVFSESFYGSGNLNISLLLPVVKSVVVVSVLILLSLSVISYFIVRFSFMLRHRSQGRFRGER